MANPTCLSATGVTSTSGVINGSADNIATTQFIRVAWSLVAGGPYNPGVNDAGTNTIDQQTNLSVSPLTPGTTVYYVLQELDTDGVTVLASSAECSFTTAMAAADSFVPMPCANCGGGSGGVTPPEFDTEQLLLCDVAPDGTILGTALMVTVYDESTGLPSGPPTPVNPATGDPYVVVGVLQPCSESGHTHTEILCDVQTDNSAVVFKRIEVLGPLNTVVDTIDVTLDGAPYAFTGTVGLCDPYATCTPDSTQNLNGDCGPGESPVQAIVAASPDLPLSNNVYNDDATADPLCGGTWDRPADGLPAGFPIAESFRNLTFDQPGPVVQGNPADLPFLTAGPPTNDGAGAGWLRLADGRGGSNGIWQVPTPFSTSQGMNAAVTLASHDGTTPGGDGQYFVFTDGAAATQATPIGGFGNLGLNNWTGGVFAVVLDEYGQSCTCGQAFPADPNPGPCGFCPNTISIQRAGISRVGASCACCTIASAPLTPKALNLTTRSQPVRLLTSVITEAGQTYVSASLDWNDGNGPIQYFDRVNITACITVPATLRMGLSMNSGGAFQAIKEARDAVARPAGVSNWRAFPITTDPIPACVTLLNVSAKVDVTFTDDGTQTAGNNNPEAYFYLVNTATNTIVASDRVSALPSQIGTPQTLTVAASVPPADLPNLRLYVGAESRDESGEYSSTWENLDITVTGTGCPATARRTLEISARCPIPVAIVSGGSGPGGGGGTTIVNTPSTFEDQTICGTVAGVATTLFRREVRNPDGAIEVTFLGLNGLPVTPDGGWVPGPCPCNGTVLTDVCITSGDFPGITLPAVAVQACDGTVTYINPGTGDPWPNFIAVVVCPPDNAFSEEILCDQGNADQPFRRIYTLSPLGSVVAYDEDLASGPYVVVGPAVNCAGGCSDPEVQIGDGGCYSPTLGDQPTIPFSVFRTCSGTIVYRDDFTGDDVTAIINTNGAGACPTDAFLSQELCDAGNGNTPFIRVIETTAAGHPGFPLASVINYDLDGQEYVGYVGPAVRCAVTIAAGRDVEQQVLCDNNGPFLRVYQFNDQSGLPSGVPADYTLAGAAYVTVGPVVACPITANITTAQFDVEQQVLCDATPTRFLRRYVYDSETPGAGITIVNTTLDGTTPFVPVGAVGVCSTPVQSDFDFLSTVLCDSAGTQFIQRLTFNSATGAVTATTNTTLTGGAFVPVGAVSLCANCCPVVIGSGCISTGSGRYTALRLPTGVISLIDSVTGAAVLAANIIACADDNLVKTLTAQARLLTNATPWTPGGDVAGTLTSLSVTGLSGLWDMVDQNGTALVGLPAGLTLTWSALDDNTLTGPTSVTPQAGSSVVANWTQR